MEKVRFASSIISSSIGNVLEWYDFGLFMIFSSLFGHLFFPTQDANAALLATFSIFAVGFLCRPIGALIFGYLGDRSGRAITLRLSVLMIALPTLLIGLLPTYQEIGIMAPILLMLIRIWQGISIGGEYSGNIIYLAETAPRAYRATFTSLACTGANLGILLATIIGIISSSLLTSEQLQTWGWRLPYLLSGFLSLFIYTFRLRIHESITFEYLKNKKKLAKNPIKVALFKNYLQILRTLGLVCMGSTFYYFCFIYIPLYLTQYLHFSIRSTSTIISIFIASMIILVPIAGWICDKVGRRKMLLFNSAFIALCVVPAFYLLQQNNLISLIVVFTIFTLASSLEQGATTIAIVENFPPPARYTGLSLGYNIGNGFLGGTVPIICAWLITITHTVFAAPFYIACCACITGTVVLFCVPETRGKPLT